MVLTWDKRDAVPGWQWLRVLDFARALLYAEACEACSRSDQWPPRRWCVEDMTACKASGCLLRKVWGWPRMTVSASCGFQDVLRCVLQSVHLRVVP